MSFGPGGLLLGGRGLPVRTLLVRWRPTRPAHPLYARPPGGARPVRLAAVTVGERRFHRPRDHGGGRTARPTTARTTWRDGIDVAVREIGEPSEEAHGRIGSRHAKTPPVQGMTGGVSCALSGTSGSLETVCHRTLRRPSFRPCRPSGDGSAACPDHSAMALPVGHGSTIARPAVTDGMAPDKRPPAPDERHASQYDATESLLILRQATPWQRMRRPDGAQARATPLFARPDRDGPKDRAGNAAVSPPPDAARRAPCPPLPACGLRALPSAPISAARPLAPAEQIWNNATL